MTAKARISATVDEDVVAAGRRAVDLGEAPTLSSWINDALTRQAGDDERLRALRTFVEDAEARGGVFPPAELEAARRDADARLLRPK